MPLCPAGLLTFPLLQFSYPYCSLILSCIFFFFCCWSSKSKLSGLTSKLGGASMYKKYVKIFIYASVFLFASNEIEQYTHISDRYPMVCNITNSLICVVFSLLYSNYM